MENIEVDMNGVEEARYKEILESEHYAELKILVGDKKETIQGITGNLPCVRFELHNIGPESISILYSTLTGFIEHLEKEYPIECLYATIMHKSTELGSIAMNPDDKKPKEK